MLGGRIPRTRREFGAESLFSEVENNTGRKQRCGRLAQRESICLTRRGSSVQIGYRPLGGDKGERPVSGREQNGAVDRGVVVQLV